VVKLLEIKQRIIFGTKTVVMYYLCCDETNFSY